MAVIILTSSNQNYPGIAPTSQGDFWFPYPSHHLQKSGISFVVTFIISNSTHLSLLTLSFG
jgi:hypothetical protein